MEAQVLITSDWLVDDFSGGITDNYINSSKTQYKSGDNFIITDERKLLVRPGSTIVDEDNYLPGYTITNPRVGLIFSFEDQIFENSGRSLYYNASGYAELLGPTSNACLGAGTSASRSSFALWNKHCFITNDAFGSPMKIYKDSGDVFRVRNAGLPKLATSPTATGSIATILAFANDVKSKYGTHIASAAAHTAGVDATHTIAAANATNLASLITLVTELLSDYNLHEKDAEKVAAWTYHAAKENADHSLASTVAPTTIDECVTKLNDLKSAFNSHANDNTAHGVTTTNVTLTDAVAHNYIYAFLYYYSYIIGTVTFEDFGAQTQVSLEGVDAPDVTNVSIASIPVIANSTTENYDTTVIKCKIYRTIDAGQTFYYVGQVTNGTTIYTDSTSDDTLLDSTIIYTDGGVLDNDPPPKCKYLVVANNICWYLHVKESSSVYPNRLRQSIQYDLDSCPETFFKDLEDEIVGGGAVGIYPIVFCKNRIYRIENFFDLTGRGGMEPREISRTVGAVNHLSITQTRDGIFFAGTDGFYFTDGYNVVKISKELNATYKTLVDTDQKKANVYGMYEALKNRIWWAVQRDSSSADNDGCFVADLNYGVSEKLPFTTFSGTNDSFAPTALLYDDNTIYRADRRGYLFVHDDSVRTDPKVDILDTPDNWTVNAIVYDYVSGAWDFGKADVVKWIPKMTLYARNISNCSIGLKSLNDDTVFAQDLKEVRIRSNIIWGDETLTWGDSDLVWNYDKVINVMRRFPAGSLRCSFKQVEITNSYTIIENSDSLGTATVDSVAKTVTLNTGPTNIWPSEAIDYYISFETDTYTEDFQITDRTDSVLTYSDALNSTSSGATTKWVIRGFRKGDGLNLLNFSIKHGFISDMQNRYHTSETGSNA